MSELIYKDYVISKEDQDKLRYILDQEQELSNTDWQPYSIDPVMKTQSPEFKKAMIELYGVEHNMHIPEVVSKMRQSQKEGLMSRYGVEHNTAVPAIKAKQLETWKKNNLEKYGVEFPAQTEENRKKSSIRFKQMQNDKNNRSIVKQIREHCKQNKIKLGSGWPMKSDEALLEIANGLGIKII